MGKTLAFHSYRGGTGKTTLASQFLYNGFSKFGESGIFVNLDESKDHLYAEMQTFGWYFIFNIYLKKE